MEWLVSLGEYVKRRLFPIHYDATFHTSEMYYTSVYLDCMRPLLSELKPRFPLSFLDAGCGTGRFLVPFATEGHRMTAIDFHKDSLRIASENAKTAGVEVTLHDGDMVKTLTSFEDESFDTVMSIEVLYTSTDRGQVMAELARVLKPGGLMFVTHRTRFYYLTQALAKGAFDDALTIATHNEGRLLKKHHRIFYNWQTRAEIEQTYVTLGMDVRQMRGIDPYTGCESDPKQPICDPGELTPDQQTKLRRVEDAADPETMMTSRYVLVAAQKPNASGR